MLLLNQKQMIKNRDGNISFFLQFLWKKLFIIYLVILMKVKIFDFEDEKDLEEEINNFLSENTINLLDIKYQVAVSVFSEEQVFCFSAMIIYS